MLNYLSISGLILIVTKNEEWTFWLLKILIEEITQSYHTKTMKGLIADIAVLRELLDQRAPEIVRHLDDIGMPFAVVTTKWFICMFAEVLPVETVLRIWDCLFLEGNKVFLYKRKVSFWKILKGSFYRFYFEPVLHCFYSIKTKYWIVMISIHWPSYSDQLLKMPMQPIVMISFRIYFVCRAH